MPYIGRGPAKSGAFRILDDFSASFDGSTTTFALTVGSTALTVGLPETLIIAVDGVIQEPGTGFTISGSNIVFGSAPQDSATFWGVELGDVGGIADNIVDGKITTAKLVDDAVTADKLANSINTEIAANTAKTGITSGQASAITANTAKVTNANHTGDVTGATALTIAAGAVDMAMLATTAGTAGSGTFLRGDGQWQAAGGDFTDGGDTASGTMVLGTNNDHNLALETSGNTRLTITNGATGHVYSRGLAALIVLSGTQSISDGTNTSVEWNGTIYDDFSMHDPSANNGEQIVMPVAGFYLVGAMIMWQGTSLTGNRRIQLTKSGTVISTNLYIPASNEDPRQECTMLDYFTANQYASVQVFQNCNTGLNLLNGCRFWAVKVA